MFGKALDVLGLIELFSSHLATTKVPHSGLTMRLLGYNKLINKLIVALLLMAFTSQSITALAMTCPFGSQTLPSRANAMMVGMDHSKMGMDGSMGMMSDHSMPSSDDQMADCCKAMGHCSLISVTNTFAISLAVASSAAIDSYTSAQPLPLASSLYRPPIFR